MKCIAALHSYMYLGNHVNYLALTSFTRTKRNQAATKVGPSYFSIYPTANTLGGINQWVYSRRTNSWSLVGILSEVEPSDV